MDSLSPMRPFPDFPFRVALAREYLRQRLAMNAGIDPMTGFYLTDQAESYSQETAEERAGRADYLQTFRDRAVGILAGLIGGCHIRVWRSSADGFVAIDPVGAAQHFYETNGEAEGLFFDRAEWELVFSKRYPETALAHAADAQPGVGLTQEVMPPWSEERMMAAIADCPIANRDEAWNSLFKSSRAEHRWDVGAFRTIWSKARGTTGKPGRRRKRAQI